MKFYMTNMLSRYFYYLKLIYFQKRDQREELGVSALRLGASATRLPSPLAWLAPPHSPATQAQPKRKALPSGLTVSILLFR